MNHCALIRLEQGGDAKQIFPLVLGSDELAFWPQFRKGLWIYHPTDPQQRVLKWTFWGFLLSGRF